MSQPQEIYTEVTVLKAYRLWLDTYEIPEEDVATLEIKWDFNHFAVGGKLMVKDSFEFANLKILNGKTTFQIFSRDFYGSEFSKTFIVTAVDQELYNNQFKVYSFTFVDQIYWKLINTYLSKSFTDTLPNIVQAYFTQLGIDTIMSSENITGNYDTGTVDSLVVPQNMNFYDFIEFQLRNAGLRMWQDRNNIYVKAIDINTMPELKDSSGNPIYYSNNTSNMYYGFKFYDYSTNYNNTLDLNLSKPIELNYRYDITQKALVDSTVNLTDMYSTLQLNNEVLNTDYFLQFTNGVRYTYQETLHAQNLKLDLEDIYNNNNNLNIVVPGNYKFNNVGKLINIQFMGNPIIKSSSLEGDTFHSGKYFINSVTERYMGNKMIQRLTLGRIDFQTPNAN